MHQKRTKELITNLTTINQQNKVLEMTDEKIRDQVKKHLDLYRKYFDSFLPGAETTPKLEGALELETKAFEKAMREASAASLKNFKEKHAQELQEAGANQIETNSRFLNDVESVQTIAEKLHIAARALNPFIQFVT